MEKEQMQNQMIYYSDEDVQNQFVVQKNNASQEKLNQNQNNTIQNRFDFETYFSQVISTAKPQKQGEPVKQPKFFEYRIQYHNEKKVEATETYVSMLDQNSSQSNVEQEFKHQSQQIVQMKVQENQYAKTQFAKIPKAKQKEKQKKRKSDQNLCKRYHCLGNKCLRKLNLYKYASKHIAKSFKKCYFFFVLIIAQKSQKFKQFKALYKDMVYDEISACLRQQQQLLKGYKGSIELTRNKDLIKLLQISIQAMNLFEAGDVRQAVEKVFCVQKLKRRNWLNQAYEEVVQFRNKLQLQIN